MTTFYEFFAGGGMARAGLGSAWDCLFANDFDPKKGFAYQSNWGTSGELKIDDIRAIKISDLPGTANLMWGSFPCQDLSLAGAGAGLKGERSGTFYPFWDIVTGLIADNRAPKIIALENVCGTLTSHKGADFQAICDSFSKADYNYGALIIDASLFVPHSRPRLFIIGVHKSVSIDPALISPGPIEPFHTKGLHRAYEQISKGAKKNWNWWNLPTPALRNSTFADLIEESPNSVSWHSKTETEQLLAMMSPLNVAKVTAAKRAGRRMVGTIYRRTRLDANGKKIQRAEVRFDNIAGCLRTPAGGSSRQILLIVDGKNVRSRLISSRETARLMGLKDSYKLPAKYNDAYHLTGDGVAVPVVAFLNKHLFLPALKVAGLSKRKVA